MSTAGVLSNIGPFVAVPEHIRKAHISKTALAVWMELASHSSPLKPTIFAIQDAIAHAISRSTRTVRTALKQLITCGLIKEIGYYQGRFKRYTLAWTNFFTDDGQKLPATQEESFQGPRKEVAADPGKKCPTDQSIRKEDLEKNTDDLESLITKHEKEWTSSFSSLDSKSGRPSQKWHKPDSRSQSGVQKTRELLDKWDDAFNNRTEIPEALWEQLRVAAGGGTHSGL